MPEEGAAVTGYSSSTSNKVHAFERVAGRGCRSEFLVGRSLAGSRALPRPPSRGVRRVPCSTKRSSVARRFARVRTNPEPNEATMAEAEIRIYGGPDMRSCYRVAPSLHTLKLTRNAARTQTRPPLAHAPGPT